MKNFIAILFSGALTCASFGALAAEPAKTEPQKAPETVQAPALAAANTTAPSKATEDTSKSKQQPAGVTKSEEHKTNSKTMK